MKNGALFKKVREKKQYSLRDLEKLTGINYQKIYRFEHGEATLSAEELNDLKIVLEIYEENVNVEEVLYEFDKFYDAYFYDKLDISKYMSSIPKTYKSFTEKIMWSIMQYGLLVLRHSCQEAELLEENLDRYNIKEGFLEGAYLDFKGCKFFLNNQHEEALSCFTSALSICSKEVLEAMVHYHMSFAYMKINKLVYASNELLVAQKIFTRKMNAHRIFGCQVHFANIEVYFKNHDEAEKMYTYCVETAINSDIELSEIAKIYRNLTWLMIKEQDLKKARNYIERARELDLSSPLMNLYSIWISYKMEHYNDAKKEIEKCKKKTNNADHLLILDLFKRLCSTKNRIPSLTTFQVAERVFRKIYKTNNVERSLFYLEIVLDLAERRENKETIIFYLKKKIELLEK